MIAINEIRQIAQKMQASGLGNIEISGKDFLLRLRCADQSHFPNAAFAKPAESVVCKAVKKGQFWATHPMQEKAPLGCGTQVKAGDCLGFLQTGELILPIRSPLDGEVVNLAVSNGEQVGQGRVLYSIKPQAVVYK
ncbi:biotin/lipoyl-containing protein [Serratia sp. M24T3]|uniref:biotin/lipoyl-containing protein n=1 Tax=Serratia sp. M24T3 TaxID=932213 RepID=UPI00025BA2FB|nr:biotin/lipoyl-containing protein [Serratia sp. M24T3]EIC85248.1 hypothetical protein SPM24T3_07414 [Serratia sp. M24T3]